MAEPKDKHGNDGGDATRAAAKAPKKEPARVPGRTIRGGRPGPDGEHYGGSIVDHEGKVLATFPNDAVNTGNPDDGTKPKPPQ